MGLKVNLHVVKRPQMHHDISVHLGHLHRGDGGRLRLAAGPVGAPRPSRAAIGPDVVQLAILSDHFDAGVADVCNRHSDGAAEVFGPLEAHDA